MNHLKDLPEEISVRLFSGLTLVAVIVWAAACTSASTTRSPSPEEPADSSHTHVGDASVTTGGEDSSPVGSVDGGQ
jgi:uncharacterized lipoprotein YajG